MFQLWQSYAIFSTTIQWIFTPLEKRKKSWYLCYGKTNLQQSLTAETHSALLWEIVSENFRDVKKINSQYKST